MATTLYEELLKEFPDHMLTFTSYLQSLDPMEPKKQLPVFTEHSVNTEDINKIVSVCDEAIKNINQDSLLTYFALRTDTRSESAKIKSQMERQKNVLVDCLCRKGIAYSKLYLYSTSGSDKEKAKLLEDITAVWKNLLKFVDPNDTKVLFMVMSCCL